MPVERIALQRAVASVRDEVISVRPARVELVGALIELAIGVGAITLLVLLFDRLPLAAMVVLLVLALIFGPIGVLGMVYGAVGVAFVMDRRARTARWQQGFLGMGIGTTDFVPFARVTGVEVAGDMDEALPGGQRQDLVRWEVRLLRADDEPLNVGAVVVARPFADEGAERANRLATALAEMAGVEARLGAVTPAGPASPDATSAIAPPRRRFRRLDASDEVRARGAAPGGEAVMQDDEALAHELLRSARTIAVVGISSDPTRPSNDVARYLIAAGYTVYLVNPVEREVLGQRVYARLQDLPEHIDIVDVFRRPQLVPEVVADAIEAGAGAVWTQLEIVHEGAAETARAAGLAVIMDRCTKIEHGRLVRSGRAPRP